MTACSICFETADTITKCCASDICSVCLGEIDGCLFCHGQAVDCESTDMNLTLIKLKHLEMDITQNLKNPLPVPSDMVQYHTVEQKSHMIQLSLIQTLIKQSTLHQKPVFIPTIWYSPKLTVWREKNSNLIKVYRMIYTDSFISYAGFNQVVSQLPEHKLKTSGHIDLLRRAGMRGKFYLITLSNRIEVDDRVQLDQVLKELDMTSVSKSFKKSVYFTYSSSARDLWYIDSS